MRSLRRVRALAILLFYAHLSHALRMAAAPTAKSRLKLGSIPVSPMGIGCWSWGNRFVYQYEREMDGGLQEAFNLCVNAGINWFDTADSYGTGELAGQSEKLLGKFIAEYNGTAKQREDIRVATKFAPYPYRIGELSMRTACAETLERINRPVLDVAQLHWRPPLGWQEASYLKGLAALRKEGVVREVGLSNYGPKKLRAVHKQLASMDVKLASLQVQFSLVSRLPLDSGLVDVCKELNVLPIAYSPLGLGLLTGKYGPGGQNLPLPPGPRGFLFSQLLPTMGPLLKTLREIAASRKKTMSQVAINWTIAKGGVPIVGVKNVAQAKENLGALGWILSPSEVKALDEAAGKMKTQATQNIFQTD